MSDPEAQAHVLALCTKARNTTLTIRSEPILSCVMEEFQTWCADNAYPFPVPTIDWPLRVYEFSQANPNASVTAPCVCVCVCARARAWSFHRSRRVSSL